MFPRKKELWNNNGENKWTPKKRERMEDFGEWLEGELKRRGMTQSELARRAGLSHSTITNIIANRRGVSSETIISIAKALEITPEDLLRDTGVLPESREARRNARIERILTHAEKLDPESQELLEEFAKMLSGKKNGKKLARKGVTS